MAAIVPTQVPTHAPSTATDFVGLAELRARAGADAGAAAHEAARQFEALFVQMMLQSMRQAGDVFGDGSDTTYRDMFDQQIAVEMTKGKGLGLADALMHQLAPGAAEGGGARELAARDFVAARQAAAPSIPTARVVPMTPDPSAMLAAAATPAFELGGPAATRGWSDWRPATPEDFVRGVWPHAEKAAGELGVDPRALVAQAALETGWGRNVARRADGSSGNNLFNIKADGGWDGDSLSVRTLEFDAGLPKPTTASFRAYPDVATAFSDYVQFLKGNPRYADALRNGADAGKFADSLQAAGYATDPGYAAKLRSIVSSPRLNDLVGGLKNLVRLPTL